MRLINCSFRMLGRFRKLWCNWRRRALRDSSQGLSGFKARVRTQDIIDIMHYYTISIFQAYKYQMVFYRCLYSKKVRLHAYKIL